MAFKLRYIHTFSCVLLHTQAKVARVNAYRASCSIKYANQYWMKSLYCLSSERKHKHRRLTGISLRNLTVSFHRLAASGRKKKRKLVWMTANSTKYARVRFFSAKRHFIVKLKDNSHFLHHLTENYYTNYWLCTNQHSYNLRSGSKIRGW